MDSNAIQEPRDGAAEGRAWAATLAEISVMPGNAWATGIPGVGSRGQAREGRPTDNRPRGNPVADEHELSRGIDKLSAILG